MTDKELINGLVKVLKCKKAVAVSYDEGGSGMEFYWSANADGWPWCSAGTLRESLRQLIEHHTKGEVE